MFPKFLAAVILIFANQKPGFNFFFQCTPPNNKVATELDYNLNGLSLDGLRTERRNGFHTHHSSPVISDGTGIIVKQAQVADSLVCIYSLGLRMDVPSGEGEERRLCRPLYKIP